MSTFFWIGIAVHVFLCGLLILLVLVQNDKGGGLAGAFGGMGGGAAFSGTGAASFISQLTRWVAIAFMGVVLMLSITATKDSSGIAESELKKSAVSTAPATQVLPGAEDLQVNPSSLPEAQPAE
jgi:preprotein translocase subunit SecG